MSPIFWIVIALFVVTDIVVVTIVLRRFLPLLPQGAGSLIGKGKALDAAHAMVGDYLRVNYSGDPGQLAAALSGLIPALREMLRSHGIDAPPEMIRMLIEFSAARHKIASQRQLREALATLA
jgi:hypothetical protein